MLIDMHVGCLLSSLEIEAFVGLFLQMLPAGDWHCPNCTCKFCGLAGSVNAEANDETNGSLLLCSLCDKKCKMFSYVLKVYF